MLFPWISSALARSRQAIPLLTPTQLTSLDAACELHTEAVRRALQDAERAVRERRPRRSRNGTRRGMRKNPRFFGGLFSLFLMELWELCGFLILGNLMIFRALKDILSRQETPNSVGGKRILH